MPIESPANVTIEEVAEFFGAGIPNIRDQVFVFSLLLGSIYTCERAGSKSWSITKFSESFRVNVGPVEVLTVDFMEWPWDPNDVESAGKAVKIRAMVCGGDCLRKVPHDDERTSLNEINYKSVREPNWVYTGSFDVRKDKRPTRSQKIVADHIFCLESNRTSFIDKACVTSTGKVRQSIHHRASHCQAIYDYAKKVMGRDFLMSKGSKQKTALVLEFEQATAGLLTDTEAERMVVQRIGQSIFRTGLMSAWGRKCCMTGLAVPALLRASHMKPWAACATSQERLDPFNGLLLAPHLDALFDGGWITVTDKGRVVFSVAMPAAARSQLGLSDDLHVAGLAEEHLPYLAYHRTLVFLDALPNAVTEGS